SPRPPRHPHPAPTRRSADLGPGKGQHGGGTENERTKLHRSPPPLCGNRNRRGAPCQPLNALLSLAKNPALSGHSSPVSVSRNSHSSSRWRAVSRVGVSTTISITRSPRPRPCSTGMPAPRLRDRKSTRLNSSHVK